MPGASFFQAWKRYVRCAFDLEGRASRSEFWWVIAIVFLIQCGILCLRISWDDASLVLVAFNVLNSLPSFTLACRRLHDADYSDAWIFIGFIPVLGTIPLLILLSMPSKEPDRFYPSQEGMLDARPA
nr:DUF805 domain-containing protein [Corynebacterium uropygiale]